MKNSLRYLWLALIPAMTIAAVAHADPQAMSAASPSVDTAAIARAVANPWRGPNNIARDKYRHPAETLAFFGVQPNQTVIEITPGNGWYTEILAPLLHDRGHYFGIIDDPESVKPEQRKEAEDQNDRFQVKLARNPDAYALTQVRQVDPAQPVLGAPGSVDTVLTFRNVHNWVMAGTQAAMFKAFFNVLKPGGTLGVTDHRANPGEATDGSHGYLTEQQVIDYATAAGFVLAGKSEINANPRDTKDWPHGVWTLPPTLSQGEVDKGKYLAIGESDRMTLRFVKPGAGAKK